MKHPTDIRSIVANLVWGILTICLVGSPSDASGRPGQTVSERDVQAFGGVLAQDVEDPVVEDVWTAEPVLAQDVEDFDGWTRLTWTVRMVIAPGTLAHVRPLYAYNPTKFEENWEAHKVHPGRVATVSTCPRNHQAEKLTGVEPPPREKNDVFWCARYMSILLKTFNSKYFDIIRRLSRPAYIATTYPLPGVEPDKRFVVELQAARPSNRAVR